MLERTQHSVAKVLLSRLSMAAVSTQDFASTSFPVEAGEDVKACTDPTQASLSALTADVSGGSGCL